MKKVTKEDRAKAISIIGDFVDLVSEHGQDISMGEMADLSFRLESLFTGEGIQYCNRLFKEGEILGVQERITSTQPELLEEKK